MNLQKYDSMMAVYTIVAKGEEYLKVKLASIDSIKPLEEQKRRRVADNFMSVCLNKGDNYAMNFRTALQLITNDSIYYTHLLKDSIEHAIHIQSKEELEMFSYKYWLPNSLLKEIEPIVMGKKRQALAIELRYPYGRVRDSLLQENAEMAWAKMKHKMIRAGQYRLANNRFAYTMAYKKVLKLSEEQLDSLAYKNYQLDLLAYQYNLIDPWNKYEGETYVKFHLERILRSGQYDTLLRLESNPRAVINAKKNWEEIKKAGLASTEDSALVCNQLFGYHLAYTSINRRYSGNNELQRRLQQQAAERKPAVLKRLEATMKLNEYETNTVNTSQ
jgi:hypothetical protein